MLEIVLIINQHNLNHYLLFLQFSSKGPKVLWYAEMGRLYIVKLLLLFGFVG